MEDKISSVYIHVPFCKKICSYCDFCKVFYNEGLVSKYLDGLKKEIDMYFKGEVLSTLYVGGGTPSCLSKIYLEEFFSILDKFSFYDKYEFTFECNISDINEELLLFLKEHRVNRLSIGVESFLEKNLKVLGRESFDVYDKILLCKRYFSNINVDLIYGINGQSLTDLKYDLDKFSLLDINHISIYSLILEDNTMLKVNGYEEIDSDLDRDMYEYICNYLESKGFIHYETSNFAKDGFSSSHNLAYWNNNKYYGFGPGASGYIGNIRYSNTRSILKYSLGEFRTFCEEVDHKTDMENFMILGLRKISGVSNDDFYKRYGLNISDVFDTSKLGFNEGFYFIKKEDLYISNYILSDFVDV